MRVSREREGGKMKDRKRGEEGRGKKWVNKKEGSISSTTILASYPGHLSWAALVWGYDSTCCPTHWVCVDDRRNTAVVQVSPSSHHPLPTDDTYTWEGQGPFHSPLAQGSWCTGVFQCTPAAHHTSPALLSLPEYHHHHALHLHAEIYKGNLSPHLAFHHLVHGMRTRSSMNSQISDSWQFPCYSINYTITSWCMALVGWSPLDLLHRCHSFYISSFTPSPTTLLHLSLLASPLPPPALWLTSSNPITPALMTTIHWKIPLYTNQSIGCNNTKNCLYMHKQNSL